MTQSIQSAPPDPSGNYGRPGRLMQVAAGVVIVAGVVFIVAVVFFWGVVAGAFSDRYGGYGRYNGPMGPGGRAGTCPMMGGGVTTPGWPPGWMPPGWMLPPTPTPTTPVSPTPRP